MKNLSGQLKTANTEEEVKNIFSRFFNIKLDTKNFIDLYTPQILFEFKFDDNLENIQTRAKVFAQTLYYMRRLKFGQANEFRALSNFICVVTKKFAVLLPTKLFKNYYLDATNSNFDWDLAPSSPCKKLIAALAGDKILRECHVYNFQTPADEDSFIKRTKEYLQEQTALFADKKVINEENFYSVFEFWLNHFGKYLDDDRKPSEYFMADIEDGKAQLLNQSNVIFTMSSDDIVKKKIPAHIYKNFWEIYAKIDNPREIISIRQKMDRMTEINRRRFTGEFFTPIDFAKKAVDYLARTIGANWWKKGNFRLWDMAAGTGNLEFALPAEALQYCYISTLLDDDAAYCKKIYPEATVFQYDYLNDDVAFLETPFADDWGFKRKMPKQLLADLKNPKIQWIIFINPPYATANNYERDKTKISKDNVSMTEIQKLMNKDNLGEVSRELFSQFLYRISLEFIDRKVWLGMFSKLKYINSNNDQKLRDKFFKYQYERGFMFSSKNFDGCKGSFPVGFLIWNLAEKISLEEQEISIDVFNEYIEKFAVKNISSNNRADFLNKWFKRPPNVKKFPPLSGGFTVAANNKDRRDRIAENFLASFMCNGNDFMHQNRATLLSAPYVSAGALSVTPENFEQCMIVHMVRRLPKATWLNDRDQFMQPTQELPKQFITDAVIWSLFAPSNQTVTLRNVLYEGETYRLKNNLYPFLISEIQDWKMPIDLGLQLPKAQDRFAALWLNDNANDISPEGAAVLSEGKRIYKLFYENAAAIDLNRWKVADWDAGWYQIRMALNDFPDYDKTPLQAAMKMLSQKLLPMIFEFGFLRDEVVYF